MTRSVSHKALRIGIIHLAGIGAIAVLLVAGMPV